MYLNEFINKYNNKKIDWDNAYGAQCVDLFRYYIKEVLGINQSPKGVNGAKNFWTNYNTDPVLKNNFGRITNTPTFVPKAGDVAIWGNGAYGHIAVCNGVGDTHTFESFDQNYPLNSACHIVKHNYTGFLGVLRPKAQDKIVAPKPQPKPITFWCRVDKAVANVRAKATSKSALAGSKTMRKGDKFQCDGVFEGEKVNGNNKWYHSCKGNFVWSGGITRI